MPDNNDENKKVNPSEITNIDNGAGNADINQDNTDTANIRAFAPADDGKEEAKPRRTIRLKPLPQNAAAPGAPQAKDVSIEETVSMDRGKLAEQDKAMRPATIIKKEDKDKAASARTAQFKVSGEGKAPEAKPAPMKLTPKAAADDEDDDTVKIKRPDKGEKVVSPSAPTAEHAVVDENAADAKTQQSRAIPGAKRTIKLRPSTAGGADKAAQTQSAPTEKSGKPASMSTIKLKPIGAGGAAAATPDAASKPALAPTAGGGKTGPKTRNTIKLMPKTGGSGPQKAPAPVPSSSQTVDAEGSVGEAAVTPSSPTVQTPAPAQTEKPKSPTIKLKPKSADAGAAPTTVKPSSPTIKYDQATAAEEPAAEVSKKPALTIRKPTSTQTPQPPPGAGADDAPGAMGDETPEDIVSDSTAAEPSWLYAVAACLVIGAMGYFFYIMVNQMDMLSKLG